MIRYELDRFAFASAPRTGTTWFLKTMAILGNDIGSKATIHIPHQDPYDLIRVSFVRNPLDWLLSCYTVFSTGAAIGVPEVDIFLSLSRNSFREFIQDYLQTCPGAVGKMFSAYRADSFIRTEDLPYGFIHSIKTMTSRKFKRTQMQQVVELGVQNNSQKRCFWDKKQKQQVMEAERQVMEFFDYL